MLESERKEFYKEQERKWKEREEKLVVELNSLGQQYQTELERRLQEEISLRDQMFQAQLKEKEQEIQMNANKQKDSLLQKEAQVLREREQLWR
jgi:hypothetical protein